MIQEATAPTTVDTDTALASRFERDVLPLSHQIYMAAMRYTRNKHDAEDLAQEVMLRAYAGFGSFRDGTSPSAWLYRILHNTWISQYRKAKCRPGEISVERIPQLQLAVVILRASNALSAEDRALESMTDDDVTAALAALREDVRTTVYYADVLGFSYKEIATMTDCPVGTVMSRLHRGRKRLRTSLFAAATRHGLVAEQRYVEPSSAA